MPETHDPIACFILPVGIAWFDPVSFLADGKRWQDGGKGLDLTSPVMGRVRWKEGNHEEDVDSQGWCYSVDQCGVLLLRQQLIGHGRPGLGSVWGPVLEFGYW